MRTHVLCIGDGTWGRGLGGAFFIVSNQCDIDAVVRESTLERLKVVIATDAIDDDVKLGEPRSHQEERVVVVQHLHIHVDVYQHVVRTVEHLHTVTAHPEERVLLPQHLHTVTARWASSTPIHSHMTARWASSTPIHSHMTIILQSSTNKSSHMLTAHRVCCRIERAVR